MTSKDKLQTCLHKKCTASASSRCHQSDCQTCEETHDTVIPASRHREEQATLPPSSPRSDDDRDASNGSQALTSAFASGNSFSGSGNSVGPRVTYIHQTNNFFISSSKDPETIKTQAEMVSEIQRRQTERDRAQYCEADAHATDGAPATHVHQQQPKTWLVTTDLDNQDDDKGVEKEKSKGKTVSGRADSSSPGLF